MKKWHILVFYSSADLDELNRRFTKKAKAVESTLWQATEQEYGSVMDAIAERVLAEFDASCPPKENSNA